MYLWLTTSIPTLALRVTVFPAKKRQLGSSSLNYLLASILLVTACNTTSGTGVPTTRHCCIVLIVANTKSYYIHMWQPDKELLLTMFQAPIIPLRSVLVQCTGK